jgi:hypothetical protein
MIKRGGRDEMLQEGVSVQEGVAGRVGEQIVTKAW